MKKKYFMALFAFLALFSFSETVNACTTVLVGKKASSDGSTMVSRNEDMDTAWAKHFVVRQANTNPTTFVSKNNQFSITLPQEQLKYTATPEWDTSKGLFEEDGINSKNVGMSATESAQTKDKITKLDPFVKDGIAEDAMVTVVLPYINSPKEGVKRLGQIVEEKGAAEANGVIFSNKNEIWYMEIVSGHNWVAVKVPDDSYAVVANTLTIGDVDLNDTEQYMASKNLSKLIKENHLAKNDKKFSVRNIFADTTKDAQYNTPRMWDAQRMLTPSKKKKITDREFNMFEKPDAPISLAKVAYIQTLHFTNTEYDTMTGSKPGKYRPISVPNTMESHILQFRNNVPEAISGIHWLALGIPDTSSYIPFYSGITDTPASYKLGSDKPDNDSAYWTYRLTNVLAKANYKEFKNDKILPLRKKVRNHLYDQLKQTDQTAEELLKNDPAKLSAYLNEQTAAFAQYSLNEYKAMNNELIVALTKKTPVEHDKNL